MAPSAVLASRFIANSPWVVLRIERGAGGRERCPPRLVSDWLTWLRESSSARRLCSNTSRRRNSQLHLSVHPVSAYRVKQYFCQSRQRPTCVRRTIETWAIEGNEDEPILIRIEFRFAWRHPQNSLYCLPMKCRRELIKQLLAFALALSVFGLSLSCLAICADHAEQSACASDETGGTSIEQEDECCSLNTLRSLPPERVQKTPAGHVSRQLSLAAVFGFYHHQTQNLTGKAPQPASSPPLQRIPELRI
jgi:hypothetical protein